MRSNYNWLWFLKKNEDLRFNEDIYLFIYCDMIWKWYEQCYATRYVISDMFMIWYIIMRYAMVWHVYDENCYV